MTTSQRLAESVAKKFPPATAPIETSLLDAAEPALAEQARSWAKRVVEGATSDLVYKAETDANLFRRVNLPSDARILGGPLKIDQVECAASLELLPADLVQNLRQQDSKLVDLIAIAAAELLKSPEHGLIPFAYRSCHGSLEMWVHSPDVANVLDAAESPPKAR